MVKNNVSIINFVHIIYNFFVEPREGIRGHYNFRSLFFENIFLICELYKSNETNLYHENSYKRVMHEFSHNIRKINNIYVSYLFKIICS